MPSDLTVQTIVVRVVALLVVAAVQGAAVACAARLLGDRGPAYDGRVTLAPAAHVEPFGAIGMVLFGWGWARPVAVDPAELRGGRLGLVAIVLAGCAGLIVLALLMAALVRPALTLLPVTAGLTMAAFLRSAADLAVGAALLGLVPVPPLTAGLLLTLIGLKVPPRLYWIAAILLLVAAWAGWLRELLGPARAALSALVLGA